LRVRVESDHVFYSAQLAPVAGNRGKPIIPSQQQIIQVQEFPALAFPAHPYFFAAVEATIAVKQEKCALPLARVAAIQLFNPP
jgi:hypothetical protein